MGRTLRSCFSPCFNAYSAFSPWCICRSIRSSSQASREHSFHPAALSCDWTAHSSNSLNFPAEFHFYFSSKLKNTDVACSWVCRSPSKSWDILYIHFHQVWESWNSFRTAAQWVSTRRWARWRQRGSVQAHYPDCRLPFGSCYFICHSTLQLKLIYQHNRHQ